jgi:solute carrier family 8 (sodium/calcium exchanger)
MKTLGRLNIFSCVVLVCLLVRSSEAGCHHENQACWSGEDNDAYGWITLEDGENTTLTGVRATHVSEVGYLIEAIKKGDASFCKDGLVLPVTTAENMWPSGVRSVVYLFALLYCFLGIAIVADVFMSSIEVITSSEKTITFIRENGAEGEYKIMVWNETVANLSLMALGSSAPEILLAIIETVKNLGVTVEGGLGPSTIVGSAAYNLLAISAVCCWSVPKGEVRRIKDVGVFAVTAFFSVFAYVWLLFVLKFNTENVVDLWEAIVTFLFFPILLFLSYFQDRNWFQKKSRSERIHPETHLMGQSGMGALGYGGTADAKELAAELVTKSSEKGEGEISDEALKAATSKATAHWMHASRMRYRINGTRMLMGGRAVIPPKLLAAVPGSPEGEEESKGERDLMRSGVTVGSEAIFSFSAPAYDVMENAGQIKLIILRTGNLDIPAAINYETLNGTAMAGEDYDHTSGTLQFGPGVDQKVLPIVIIDDNIYEPDEFFLVQLAVPKGASHVEIGHPHVAQVTIINDDDPGCFGFSKAAYSVVESDGTVSLSVERVNGCDGDIDVKYKSVDTPKGAVAGRDYEVVEGVLHFKHGETKKTITVTIIDDKDFEKDEAFTVELEIVGYPECGAEYGSCRRTEVTITNDEEFAKMVEKVSMMLNINLDRLKINTNSWGEQFRNAMTPGGLDNTEELPTIVYIMHFLTFFWKVLFACIPPTSFYGGYLTFVIALVTIGMVTAVVGDIAGIFGCTLGMSDALTAITFVALGTSLPDTFASKAATVNDEHADASIGNVTGSNSVNVFLGLGLPWLIATIYGQIYDFPFVMSAGSLGFSVTIFCICAVVALAILVARRFLCGGELGGAERSKLISSVIFFLLWILYVVLAGLQSEGIIEGF